jgi:vacuolar-type H+-ATPase subunit F/Vma7
VARVAVIGEPAAVAGYALVGAVVCVALDASAARSQWDSLPDDVAVVILTPLAARALGDRSKSAPARLAVVMPS